MDVESREERPTTLGIIVVVTVMTGLVIGWFSWQLGALDCAAFRERALIASSHPMYERSR